MNTFEQFSRFWLPSVSKRKFKQTKKKTSVRIQNTMQTFIQYQVQYTELIFKSQKYIFTVSERMPCRRLCKIKQYNTLLHFKSHANSHCTATIYVSFCYKCWFLNSYIMTKTYRREQKSETTLKIWDSKSNLNLKSL